MYDICAWMITQIITTTKKHALIIFLFQLFLKFNSIRVIEKLSIKHNKWRIMYYLFRKK